MGNETFHWDGLTNKVMQVAYVLIQISFTVNITLVVSSCADKSRMFFRPFLDYFCGIVVFECLSGYFWILMNCCRRKFTFLSVFLTLEVYLVIILQLFDWLLCF